MRVFVAGTSSRSYLIDALETKPPYILESFCYIAPWQYKYIDLCKMFLLDSGAFTFMKTKGKDIDIQAYVDRYISFINEYNVRYFFELDIDSVIGYDGVKKITQRLESRTGRQPIPVWHKSRGKQNFIDMRKNYRYVAIGGIAGIKEKREIQKYFKWFIDTAHENGAEIHGLGHTNFNDLKINNFDSVDSSSWTSGARYGTVYEFRDGQLISHNKPQGKRGRNYKEIDINNINEWIKFANYAERYL